MIEAGRVEVTTFQVESPKAEVVHAMQSRHGYSMYITVNPHTAFKPEPTWESSVSGTQRGLAPVAETVLTCLDALHL